MVFDTQTVLMKNLVLEGLNIPMEIDLKPGLNKVGRNPTNDVRVSEPSVSSFHCEIVVTDENITIRDLASTNGTFIDGQSVQESQIGPGQRVQLGSAEFRMTEKEVIVAIPEGFSKDDTHRKPPVMFDDGTPACSVYEDKRATYECRRCKKFFSREAIRSVNISGGESLLFGFKCHGPCDLEARFEDTPNRKVNLFGRLTQTIRLRKS